jgi:hypothetical protein
MTVILFSGGSLTYYFKYKNANDFIANCNELVPEWCHLCLPEVFM